MDPTRLNAIVDDLLAQAYGPDLGRLIAGSYRMAMTAAQMAARAEQPDEDSPKKRRG